MDSRTLFLSTEEQSIAMNSHLCGIIATPLLAVPPIYLTAFTSLPPSARPHVGQDTIAIARQTGHHYGRSRRRFSCPPEEPPRTSARLSHLSSLFMATAAGLGGGVMLLFAEMIASELASVFAGAIGICLVSWN